MTNRSMIVDSGPFRVGITASESEFLDALDAFYPEIVRCTAPQVLDYDIRLERPRGLRRWLRPQILFRLDDMQPFQPHPVENAFPLFEWGLNWCVATSAHRYLMLHAATIAFGDQALLMPGAPGSGKSTLAAALHLRGARLMSDEFGLLRPERGDLVPMPRGIPLKNDSIEAILAFEPTAALGPTFPKTRKGRVRHLRPSRDAQSRQMEPAVPRWLVFPRFRAGAGAVLRPLDRTEAFRQLAFNCFNYRLLGATAFRAVQTLVRDVDCFTFEFGSLDSACPALEVLAGKSLRHAESGR